MIPAQIIAKKRDGESLSDDEIGFFVQGFAKETIPDYQMAALAMAIYLNGMTTQETADLTRHMLESGARLSWKKTSRPIVDKHSTGGVGDKISLPLAPLLAALGMRVPMLSGRGLGPTGGTLDKLESIPGFRTDLSIEEIERLTEQVGCVITGASSELAPADQKLYGLRDVTGTVPSIPLITASIMSKKLAESPEALVLDVKFGSGAFMKTPERAQALADSLVATGERMGVKTSALLSDMNQPLGRMVGNAVEVNESLDVLNGGGPDDVVELTIRLAAEALLLTGGSASPAEATATAQQKLSDGSAIAVYREMIVAQGGNPDASLPVAPSFEVVADRSGVVHSIDTEQLGFTIIAMGGGRKTTGERIDHSIGLEMLVRLGDEVTTGAPIVKLMTQAPDDFRFMVQDAIHIA